MGYRNEIYRVNDAGVPSVKTPPEIKAGSFCVPASLQDWARRGWDIFKDISHAENSATRTNLKDASIIGLSYSLQLCHEAKEENGGCEKIMLRIDSWTYDNWGESTDLPIMELIFDAVSFSSPAKSLESLKVMARPVQAAEKVASRAVTAALFFINQINAGQVPDFERVLELHRVHPDLNKTTGRLAGHKNKNARGPYTVRSRMITLDKKIGQQPGKRGNSSSYDHTDRNNAE